MGVLVGTVRYAPTLHDLDAVEATAPLHVDIGPIGAGLQCPRRQLYHADRAGEVGVDGLSHAKPQ